MKKFTDNIITYDQARSQIKDGDIVFVSETSTFVGKLIKVFTGSPIFHVGIACWMTMPNGKKLLCSCEQWYGGRRIVNLRTYTNSSLIVVDNPVQPFTQYMDELILNTGSDYGYLDFVNAGLYDLSGIEMKNNSGEICSEIIMRIINYHMKTNLYPVVSPAKLFDILTNKLNCKIKLQTEI